MRHFRFELILALILLAALPALAAGITVKADRLPASQVFEEVARQSGKNFIYDADLLKGVDITVDVRRESLKSTLRQMFLGLPIDFKIKGRNILLFQRRKRNKAPKTAREETAAPINDPRIEVPDSVKVGYLRELTVSGSRNQTLAMESPQIGALNVSRSAISRTPVLFGESDVIKTLQLEPGISAGAEGMAGMYVHGGNHDENLYMLDNIPLYQVNHFAGLFSAFNTEAVKNVDFFKTTFPAKFDGRLSSYMDVYTREGSFEKFSGSARLGLTSGGANVEGPIWKGHTSFAVAVRRSWFDILTLPFFAIANSTKAKGEDHNTMGYAFTDVNAKITHRFSSRSRIYLTGYFGEDYLRGKMYLPQSVKNGFRHDLADHMRWGNIMASAGWIFNYHPDFYGRLTAAYTNYTSRLTDLQETADVIDGVSHNYTSREISTRNRINDWILRGDFEWRTAESNSLNFGTIGVLHDFLPSRSERKLFTDGQAARIIEDSPNYHAREWGIYAEDNFNFLSRFRLSAGVHFSLFNITGKTKHALSPRLALSYHTGPVAVKAAYSRTAQYVHQLSASSISLPTDRWVPIIGDQKPQTADKISLGVYWHPWNGVTLSAEGYMKWMHNLVDYKDEYYLLPPETRWDGLLAEGKGKSRGLDFKISKEFGRVTGQISYSLLWADRQFANRNGGRPYPARYDNRHKINILVDWKINDRWEMSASWIGMSGNRITLPTQLWLDPGLTPWNYEMKLQTDINNFRLPFYNRLDLSFTRHTRHGYWTFGLYNAYCYMNAIAVQMGYSNKDYVMDGYAIRYKPVYKYVKLIPTIPSVSYTWLF